MDMDVDSDIIRGRSTLSSKAGLRDSLILSNTSSILYHQCMELNNDLSDVGIWEPINSSQLSYAGSEKIGDVVSMATNKALLGKANIYTMRHLL